MAFLSRPKQDRAKRSSTAIQHTKTMKTLVLIRHAHSPNTPLVNDDHSRTLSSKGVSDAKNAGSWIMREGLAPDHIVSSPSVRTLTTIRHICEQASIPLALIQSDKRLYESTVEDYQTVVSETQDETNTLFLVGHNFAITQLLMGLTGNYNLEMTPCTVAVLTLDTMRWSDSHLISNSPFLMFNP